MKATIGLLYLLFLVSCNAISQTTVKGWFNPADTVYGFYAVTEPASHKPKAMLVLLDGYGGNAFNFLQETTIDEQAYKNDILTVSLPTGKRLYADDAMVQLINLSLSHIISKYGIAKDKVVMGGFSSGGTIVLRYAELCKQHPSAYPVNPRAVFTGDSPIDLAGLYYSSKKELKKNHNGWWLAEAKMIVDTLYSKFGDPQINRDTWQSVNPFNEADTTTGNEKYLKDIAYRTYHDVDVNWYLKNRKRSLYVTNLLNASELISRLLLLGNQEAEFIQSPVHGQRSNGEFHPHSWNIIDAEDLINWIKQKTGI